MAKRYTYDIKCFVTMTIIADDEDAANAEAEAFVDSLDPDINYSNGWNEKAKAERGVWFEGYPTLAPDDDQFHPEEVTAFGGSDDETQ